MKWSNKNGIKKYPISKFNCGIYVAGLVFLTVGFVLGIHLVNMACTEH